MDLNDFYGPNAGYILELYDRFLADPNSVDAATRQVFATWQPPAVESQHLASQQEPIEIAAAVNLAQAIRTYGHLAARLDPLGSPPPGDPWLDPARYGLTEAILRRLPPEIVGAPVCEHSDNAWEAIQALRRIYCSGTGYEYGHIHNPAEREWLRRAAECGVFRPPDDPIDPLALLERLTQVEVFEHFLHRIFPGKTRFSIEGVDMLVPMLDHILNSAADLDVRTAVIGMAHRGRLNVLAHILGQPYELILAEFKDPVKRFHTREELGWMGDVKYHKGAHHALEAGEEVQMVVTMPPNPSHLEHVNPVAEGMVRAAASRVDQPGPPEVDPSAALPILIHGDAAFPGQGVVAETLNMSRLPGYWTGGTIHIITNNQLGYTATPQESRSTDYASDLGIGFEIPVMHVNADDPPACIEAARTAFAYRARYHKDFLIDLIGYRRYGHNEGDEPGFTQPVMYANIEKHPSVRKLWGDRLARQGEIPAGRPDELYQQGMNQLQEINARLEPEQVIAGQPVLEPPPRGAARHVDTAVPLETLAAINQALITMPEGFHLNRKLSRVMQRRQGIFEQPDEPGVDWAAAEQLALASILADGVPIRLTGEDSERGTFSHRHAVLHDGENGQKYAPLQHFPQARAAFEVLNSPLSENAAIGFEFGYNLQSQRSLVIWEAQYGDFINTAQAMLDEFVVSARAKWEQTPSLVLLLPHADEGQGPDHSSGRPERFLQMAADFNLRLANCTTAAQYFHLLRRQSRLLEVDPLPLIVLTPKSLLRHPLTASTPRQLAEGRWQPLLDDDQARQRPEEIRRVLLCSGKVYVDLVSSELRPAHPEIAILRLEQIYPFRDEVLREMLSGYPKLEAVTWVQEEPANMGAWSFLRPLLMDCLGERWQLHQVARTPAASPAEGSSAWHALKQQAIVQQAFETGAGEPRRNGRQARRLKHVKDTEAEPRAD